LLYCHMTQALGSTWNLGDVSISKCFSRYLPQILLRHLEYYPNWWLNGYPMTYWCSAFISSRFYAGALGDLAYSIYDSLQIALRPSVAKHPEVRRTSTKKKTGWGFKLFLVFQPYLGCLVETTNIFRYVWDGLKLPTRKGWARGHERP
jgi:hypothetical protein